jgi:Na+-driven multidrug efflux pump
MQQGVFKFKILLIFVTVIGLATLLAIIFWLSPYQEIVMENGESKINLLNLIGIYSSLFTFFAGLFTTIFFWLRGSSKELYISAITSLRQGALMGFFVCILLFLQSFNLLIWWDILLVILAVILIEMYLAVNDKHVK